MPRTVARRHYGTRTESRSMRAIRAKYGLSQSALAAEIGATQSLVSHIEHQRHALTPEIRARLDMAVARLEAQRLLDRSVPESIRCSTARTYARDEFMKHLVTCPPCLARSWVSVDT